MRWLGVSCRVRSRLNRAPWSGGFAEAVRRSSTLDVGRLPIVALLGRPNVGKSALFNRLVKKRDALVMDTPEGHVTRDYREGVGHLGDLTFSVMDTSGLEPHAPTGSLLHRAASLTAAALRRADVALLLLDARDGISAADHELAAWLRRTLPRSYPLILVANKAETAAAQRRMPDTVAEVASLGLSRAPLVALSATSGEGQADLYQALQPLIDARTAELQAAGAGQLPARRTPAPARHEGVEEAAAARPQGGERRWRAAEAEAEAPAGAAALSDSSAEEDGEWGGGAEREDAEGELAGEDAEGGAGARQLPPLRLAIVGLPNAGKSTLLNRLLGHERALTGPEPGLTRDPIHAPCRWGPTLLELVDTAGWVKRSALAQPGRGEAEGELAGMAQRRARRSLAGVHVVLLLLDARRLLQLGRVITKRELELGATCLEEGKALVIGLNKVDALSATQRAQLASSLEAALRRRFTPAGKVPLVALSGAQGDGVEQLMDTVVAVYAAWNKRMASAQIMRLLQKLEARLLGSGPAAAALRRVKFMHQLKARPPTFVASLRGGGEVSEEGRRFIASALRLAAGLDGVPIRIHFQGSRRDQSGWGRGAARATRTTSLHEWAEQQGEGGEGEGGGAGGAARTPAARRRGVFSPNVQQFLRDGEGGGEGDDGGGHQAQRAPRPLGRGSPGGAGGGSARRSSLGGGRRPPTPRSRGRRR